MAEAPRHEHPVIDTLRNTALLARWPLPLFELVIDFAYERRRLVVSDSRTLLPFRVYPLRSDGQGGWWLSSPPTAEAAFGRNGDAADGLGIAPAAAAPATTAAAEERERIDPAQRWVVVRRPPPAEPLLLYRNASDDLTAQALPPSHFTTISAAAVAEAAGEPVDFAAYVPRGAHMVSSNARGDRVLSAGDSHVSAALLEAATHKHKRPGEHIDEDEAGDDGDGGGDGNGGATDAAPVPISFSSPAAHNVLGVDFAHSLRGNLVTALLTAVPLNARHHRHSDAVVVYGERVRTPKSRGGGERERKKERGAEDGTEEEEDSRPALGPVLRWVDLRALTTELWDSDSGDEGSGSESGSDADVNRTDSDDDADDSDDAIPTSGRGSVSTDAELNTALTGFGLPQVLLLRVNHPIVRVYPMPARGAHLSALHHSGDAQVDALTAAEVRLSAAAPAFRQYHVLVTAVRVWKPLTDAAATTTAAAAATESAVATAAGKPSGDAKTPAPPPPRPNDLPAYGTRLCVWDLCPDSRRQRALCADVPLVVPVVHIPSGSNDSGTGTRAVPYTVQHMLSLKPLSAATRLPGDTATSGSVWLAVLLVPPRLSAASAATAIAPFAKRSPSAPSSSLPTDTAAPLPPPPPLLPLVAVVEVVFVASADPTAISGKYNTSASDPFAPPLARCRSRPLWSCPLPVTLPPTAELFAFGGDASFAIALRTPPPPASAVSSAVSGTRQLHVWNPFSRGGPVVPSSSQGNISSSGSGVIAANDVSEPLAHWVGSSVVIPWFGAAVTTKLSTRQSTASVARI